MSDWKPIEVNIPVDETFEPIEVVPASLAAAPVERKHSTSVNQPAKSASEKES